MLINCLHFNCSPLKRWNVSNTQPFSSIFEQVTRKKMIHQNSNISRMRKNRIKAQPLSNNKTKEKIKKRLPSSEHIWEWPNPRSSQEDRRLLWCKIYNLLVCFFSFLSFRSFHNVHYFIVTWLCRLVGCSIIIQFISKRDNLSLIYPNVQFSPVQCDLVCPLLALPRRLYFRSNFKWSTFIQATDKWNYLKISGRMRNQTTTNRQKI